MNVVCRVSHISYLDVASRKFLDFLSFTIRVLSVDYFEGHKYWRILRIMNTQTLLLRALIVNARKKNWLIEQTRLPWKFHVSVSFTFVAWINNPLNCFFFSVTFLSKYQMHFKRNEWRRLVLFQNDKHFFLGMEIIIKVKTPKLENFVL